MTKSVTIYTKDYCPYCADAKELLDKKGASFTEIDLVKTPDRRDEMVKRASGRTSVPQIFIDGVHVGGCDDLYALESAGKLTPLLAD
ncbi:glutaredoxin 3 [Candidatus Raskinella chloraquaticus]|uniref:Glutaredoxin n=1 Tax=Candidatus Raskinella chloraquaticus TaxID=1951219 RepID=A0A1W9HZ88_9HYPH|nr:MAG: glutaredoxin [Proteobacteria bacterium SG_bin8]